MGVSDLQDALDNLDDIVRKGYGVPPVIVAAARRVANPDYEAAAEIIGSVIQPAFVRMAVNAALGIK